MIKRVFAASIAFLIYTLTPLWGQMSGAYTIGGNAGSRNFSSWEDFVAEWNKSGISGNVDIQVQRDETISKRIVLKQHSSAQTSPNKKIRIYGNGKKLMGNFNHEVLHLMGIDHVDIRQLVIENSSTNTALLGLRFSSRADSNIIDSCSIVFTKLEKLGTDTGAYIAFTQDSGRITKSLTAHPGIGNQIRNGNFYCTLPQSPGPFFGIYDQQGTADYSRISTHNIFESNRISTFYAIGIFMRFVNGERCINNRITREECDANSRTDTTMIGIFCLDGRSDVQEIAITDNEIVHLPYKNAALKDAGDYIKNLFGINVWKLIGGSKKIIRIEGNTLEDLTFYQRFHGVLSQYSEQVSISENRIYQIQGDRGYSVVIYSQYGDDVRINRNLIRRLDLGSRNTGQGTLIFCNEMGSGTWGLNTILSNVLDSNSASTELFTIAAMRKGNWDIGENIIQWNQTYNAQGKTIGIYFYYCENTDIHDNLLAHNYGPLETYGMYSTNYNTSQSLYVRNNTLYDSIATSTAHISAFMYLDDDSKTEVVGNIIQGIGSQDFYPMYLNTVGILGDVKYNSIYLKNYGSENWAFEVNQYSNFKDWNLSGARDSFTYWIPGLFRNDQKSDFRSAEYRNQNNVPSSTRNTRDVFGRLRHPSYTDRGAVIDSLNLGIVLKGNFPDTVCSGFELAKLVQIFNGYSDTVTDLRLQILQNGVLKTYHKRLAIRAGDTSSFILDEPVILNTWGWNSVRLNLASANDFGLDDTLNYRIFVKPSPGGSMLITNLDSSKPNIPVIGKDHDIVVLNREWAFWVTAPRGYSRADYGKNLKWYAETQAYTEGGRTIQGAGLKEPNSGSDLNWNFTSNDTTLEDSFVFVKLRIYDLSGACDTLITRRIYIEPTPILDFELQDTICVGDTLWVKNLTRLNAGNSYMRYYWDFGNSDTSSDYSFYTIYADSGVYTISLKVTTSPYNYVFKYNKDTRVNPVPNVSFSRGIACDGQLLSLENTSDSRSANFTWDFGDGTAKVQSNTAEMSHRYTQRGNYFLSLMGEERGCSNAVVQRVTVFEQPIAQALVDTVACQNAILDFVNKTQMTSAIFGVRWDFAEAGAFATQKNVQFKYDTAGFKKVQYSVKSEFGCTDTTWISIEIKPAPQVQFVSDKTCINQETKWVNKSPSISGILRQIEWRVNGELASTKDSFFQDWIDTGSQEVSLKVIFDNGCFDSLVQKINVLNVAQIDFDFEELCAGDSVSLINTTVPAEGLDYIWTWGEGNTSTEKDIKVVFDATDSMDIPVSLTAKGLGYCEAIRTQSVTVLPRPKTCDFVFDVDYDFAFYGMIFEPINDLSIAGGQMGITYVWDIESGGEFMRAGLDAKLQHAFDQDGTYSVAMTAKTDAHGCTCSAEKVVVMDRLSRSNESIHWSVFPNPVSDSEFQIKGTGALNGVRLWSLDGKFWDLNYGQTGSDSYRVSLPDLSSGIYELELREYGINKRVRLAITRP